jgi:hypothetical protein
MLCVLVLVLNLASCCSCRSRVPMEDGRGFSTLGTYFARPYDSSSQSAHRGCFHTCSKTPSPLPGRGVAGEAFVAPPVSPASRERYWPSSKSRACCLLIRMTAVASRCPVCVSAVRRVVAAVFRRRGVGGEAVMPVRPGIMSPPGRPRRWRRPSR